MKKKLHPKINEVVFKDVSCDFAFLGQSTATSQEKILWEDGREYPLIKVEISSASHPFFTTGRYLSAGRYPWLIPYAKP